MAIEDLLAQLGAPAGRRFRAPMQSPLALGSAGSPLALGPGSLGSSVQLLAGYERPAAAASSAVNGLGTGARALPAGQRIIDVLSRPASASRVFPMGPASTGATSGLASTLAAQVPQAGRVMTAADLAAGGSLAAPGAAAGAPAAAQAGGLAAKLRGRLGVIPKGGLMRGAGYAGLGVLAGSATDKLVGEHNNSSWDEAATGAVTGAGVGAAIGSVVPVIGTGVGALAGGLGGGVIGLLGPKTGGETPTNQELARQLGVVDQMASKAGLDADTRNLLAMQLQTGRAGVNDQAGIKQLSAEVQAMIPQLAVEQREMKKQESRTLALQAMMQPFLEKYLDRSATAARESQVVLNDAAGRLPAPLAELYRARGANIVSDADSMNAALLAQILNQPNADAQQLQEQINAQIRSQAIAKAAAQTTGGGPQSLDQLLAGG